MDDVRAPMALLSCEGARDFAGRVASHLARPLLASHALGQIEHLDQAVGDVDDGDAARLQAAHQIAQYRHFLRGQRGCRLVIITNWRHRYDQNVDGRTNTVSLDEWRDATRAAAEPLVQAGKKVLLLSDTPYPHRQVDQCLASSPRNVTRCHLDRAKALDTDDNTMLRELAPQIGATFVETTDWFCTPTTCPAVVGNMAVYQDTNHINNTYGLFLAPYLELVVKEQLQLLA